ncbi:hypothetical protein M975_4069 [Buttiauxella brennerae ATCC 51605]|uniref:Uncharacterized protein n=1 Tax=Buttiauxella brennerae ATCC 51605 TaxID=1354251 RepID=A0A1B7IEV4_9ENTR|nr:hypothetical protein M975_4069 [Buttiauxella brennerae ATCC 51605]
MFEVWCAAWRTFFPSSSFKLTLRWLLSQTRITYMSKLIGIFSFAALIQLE